MSRTFSNDHRASMSRAASRRMREGQRPVYYARHRNAELIGSFDRDGATWELYDFIPTDEGSNLAGHVDHGGNWSNHKLVAMPGRAGKANYWFAYNHNESRFSKSKHVMHLLEHEPVVYAWVLATLDPDTYGGMI